MDNQPANVVPFVPPARTTLPYPVQVVADALELQQIDDQDDLIQFTIIRWELGPAPTFCIRRGELSVSTLAVTFCETMAKHLRGHYREVMRKFETIPETQGA